MIERDESRWPAKTKTGRRSLNFLDQAFWRASAAGFALLRYLRPLSSFLLSARMVKKRFTRKPVATFVVVRGSETGLIRQSHSVLPAQPNGAEICEEGHICVAPTRCATSGHHQGDARVMGSCKPSTCFLVLRDRGARESSSSVRRPSPPRSLIAARTPTPSRPRQSAKIFRLYAFPLRNVGCRVAIERRRQSSRRTGGHRHEKDLSSSGDKRRIAGCRCVRQCTRNFDGWGQWSRSQPMLGRCQQGHSRPKWYHRDRAIWKHHRRFVNIGRLKLWQFHGSGVWHECERQCLLAPGRNA